MTHLAGHTVCVKCLDKSTMGRSLCYNDPINEPLSVKIHLCSLSCYIVYHYVSSLGKRVS